MGNMAKTVDARLTFQDRLGGWRVRWGIGRYSYLVEPGMYAIGKPSDRDVVLVTANYKLTFDSLRKELNGINAWILVLDTRGINVWCAAGKGTFGTDELVKRLQSAGVDKVVTHRTLIVPQLGAPGVSGFEVFRRTGFRVVFGPVRAGDLPRFLERGVKADQEMRIVTFSFLERLAVIPVELVMSLKYFAVFSAIALVLWVLVGGSRFQEALSLSLSVLGAFFTGIVLVPALLPWIPFRSFALKGWTLGLFWAVAAGYLWRAGPWRFCGNLLLLPALSAFLSLNFTGASTFTSQTGVNREIKLFAKPMGVAAALGLLLTLVGAV